MNAVIAAEKYPVNGWCTVGLAVGAPTPRA